MSFFRKLAKSLALLLVGRKFKPRRILRGLASGYKISVSPAEHFSYLLGTYEPYLQAAIRKYVRAGDVVYDIGANIGYVSLALAKQVGPRGRVIAFEPIPENVSLLRQNIAQNRVANVCVLEKAASNASGEGVLRVSGNYATASLVWHRHDPKAVEVGAKTIALDDCAGSGEIPPPRFVKIDVEGGEALVLEGMQKLLAASKPVVFIECSDAGREASWKLLTSLGYRCQSALTRRWIQTLDDYRASDFIWVPQGPTAWHPASPKSANYR